MTSKPVRFMVAGQRPPKVESKKRPVSGDFDATQARLFPGAGGGGWWAPRQPPPRGRDGARRPGRAGEGGGGAGRARGPRGAPAPCPGGGAGGGPPREGDRKRGRARRNLSCPYLSL